MFAENFGVVNVEYMDGVAPLLVVSVYSDANGRLVNNIIVPFKDYPAVLTVLLDANVYHVWTSDKELYTELLKSPFISTEFKHKTETIDTANAVESEADILKSMYGLKPTRLRRFAALRGWISDQLIKLALAINY